MPAPLPALLVPAKVRANVDRQDNLFGKFFGRKDPHLYAFRLFAFSMNNSALVIFVKNLETERSRAGAHGPNSVFEASVRLHQLTRDITLNLPVHKFVFYSEEISSHDHFDFAHYEKDLLQGSNRAERINTALKKTFDLRYEKIVLIGSECIGITSAHILAAYDALDDFDMVIGPDTGGGYYLIGMKAFYPDLFQEQAGFASGDLLLDTVLLLQERNLTYTFLETLSREGRGAAAPFPGMSPF